MTSELAEKNDPLLGSYLDAPEPGANAQLAALFTLHAGPIVERILRAKQPNDAEIEDVISAAREQLLRQVTLLRRGQRAEPIRDFRAYAARVAYSAWAEHLRQRHPQRALLLNRLRYLLENRTPQKGFAVWQDAEGAQWCGFQSWRGRTGGATPRRQWLLSDAKAATREALPDADPKETILPELIAALFRWLGGPIELRNLTNVIDELVGPARNEGLEKVVEIDPRPSPAEDLVWKEYLSWLWREIRILSERQRRAFLLHLEILGEFELLGIASIRAVAGALDFSPNEMAALWNRLPLDDLSIAKMLDCTRQQVINLRRVARDKLGAAWREWNAGNK